MLYIGKSDQSKWLHVVSVPTYFDLSYIGSRLRIYWLRDLASKPSCCLLSTANVPSNLHTWLKSEINQFSNFLMEKLDSLWNTVMGFFSLQ